MPSMLILARLLHKQHPSCHYWFLNHGTQTTSQSTVASGMEVYVGRSGWNNTVGTRLTLYLWPTDLLAQNVNCDHLQSSATATVSHGNCASAECCSRHHGVAINPPALLAPALTHPSILTVVGVLYPNCMSAHLSNTHQCTQIIATILQIEFPPEYPSHWVLHWKHKDAFLIHTA